MTQPRGDRPQNVSSLRWDWVRALRADPRVGKREWLVASALKERMNRGGYCSFPTPTLAADARMTASTWIKGWRELVRLGWLEVKVGGGSGRRNEYWAVIPESLETFEVSRPAEASKRSLEAVRGSLETARKKPLRRRGEGVRTRCEVGRRSVLEGELELGLLQRRLRNKDGLADFAEHELTRLDENERAVLAECEELLAAGDARWVDG